MKKSIGAKTLVYPTPAFVIGTYDKDGRPNVMTAAWAGICCSKPPCVGVSLRKARYSYDNIVARKAFTVNVPSETYVKETDMDKVKPILFAPEMQAYYGVGNFLGKAFAIGKEI